MSWSRHALAAAMILALAGCGFSARSVDKIPEDIESVYVETPDRYSEFYRALTTEIRGSRLALMDGPGEADMVISVALDITGQRTLSVSGRNVPTEFQVWYTVQYAVYVDGDEALGTVQHTRTRDYTYDETLVLGKANEEQNIRKALANQLVGLVVQRVASLN